MSARPQTWAMRLLAGGAALAAGWWVGRASVNWTGSDVAPRVQEPVAVMAAAPPAPCPEVPVPDAPAGVADEPWDPLEEERRLWEDLQSFVGPKGGEVLVVDCVRWPCLAKVVWRAGPEEGPADLKELRRRFPGARLHVGGTSNALNPTLVLHHASLTEQQQREVRLRLISVKLESGPLRQAFLERTASAPAPDVPP